MTQTSRADDPDLAPEGDDPAPVPDGDRVTDRRWDLAALTGMLLVLGAQQVWWISRHRARLSVSADEGRLLTWAVQAQDAAGRGLGDLASAWRAEPTSAPLLGVLSAVSAQVFGRSPTSLMLPEVGFYLVLLVAVWLISQSLGAGRWGLLAVFVIGVSPGVLAFTRSYEQIIPGAAFLCTCVAIGARSDDLRSRRAVVLLGAAIGLSLVTRAMLVVFVPWTLAIAVAVSAWRGHLTRRVVANVALAAGTSLAIAATWWAFSFRTAYDYLHAGATGPAPGGPLSRSTWIDEAVRAGRTMLGVPAHTWRWPALALIALIAVVAVGRQLRGTRRDPAGMPIVYVTAVTAVCLLALVLARDDHLGFSLLIVPLATVLGMSALAQERSWVFRVALGALVLGGVAAAAHSFDSDRGFYQFTTEVHAGRRTTATERDAWGPAYERIVLGDGTPADRVRRADLAVQDPMMDDKQLVYVAADAGVTLHTDRLAERRPDIVSSPVSFGRWLPVAVARGDDVITTSRRPVEALTGLTTRDLAPVLRRAGFVVLRTVRLPDGRVVTVWRRPR